MLNKNSIFLFFSIFLGLIISFFYNKELNESFIAMFVIITLIFYIIFYYLGNTYKEKNNIIESLSFYETMSNSNTLSKDNFDWTAYVSRYPDLKKAGINNLDKAWSHYVNAGKKEKRIATMISTVPGKTTSSDMLSKDNFDWTAYVSRYPDLKKAGINNLDKAWSHYVNAGKKEKRIATMIIPKTISTVPTSTLTNNQPNLNNGIKTCNLPDNFDLGKYVMSNNDLKKINPTQLNAAKVVSHYFNNLPYDKKKNCKLYNLPNDFNPFDYQMLNKDLKNLNPVQLINHYLNNGIKENRKYKIKDSKIDNVIQDETYIKPSLYDVIQDETYIKPSLYDVIQDETYMEPSLYDVIQDETYITPSLYDVIQDETYMEPSLYDVIQDETYMEPSLYDIQEESDKDYVKPDLNKFLLDNPIPNTGITQNTGITPNTLGITPFNINISYNSQNSSNELNNNKENFSKRPNLRNYNNDNNDDNDNNSRIYNNDDWNYGNNAWTNNPDYYVPRKIPQQLNQIMNRNRNKENTVCPLMVNTPWTEYNSGDEDQHNYQYKDENEDENENENEDDQNSEPEPYNL